MGLFAHKLAVGFLVVGIGTAGLACSSGSGGKGATLGSGGGGATTTAAAANGAGSGTSGATGTSAPAGGQPSNGPATTSHPGAPTGTAAPAGATATTGAKVTTPAPSGPAPAAAGTYNYRLVSGSSMLTMGSTTSSVPPSDQNTLVVTSTGGGAQQWTTNGSATSYLMFNGAGVFLQSETVPAVGTCTFNPPVAWPPWPLAVGKTFSGQASCGSATVSLQGRVSGTASLSVGGVNVGTFLVQSTLTVTGTSLVVAETDWYAPSLRLPVQSTVIAQGGIPRYSIASNTTYALTSSRPA